MRRLLSLLILVFGLQNLVLMAQSNTPALQLKSTVATGAGSVFAFGNQGDTWAISGYGFPQVYEGSKEKHALRFGTGSPGMRFTANDDSVWVHDICQDLHSDTWKIPSQLWDLDGRGRIVSSCYPNGERILVGFATYRPRKTLRVEPPTPRSELIVMDLQTGIRLLNLAADFEWYEYINLDFHGSWVATGVGDSLYVWNWETGKVVFGTYIVDDGPSPFLDFSPDGKHLVLGTVNSGEITIWETEHWTQTAHFRNPYGRLSGAVFLPDNKSLVLSNDEGGLSIWDSKTSKRIWTSGAMKVNAMAMHPSGKELHVNVDQETWIYSIVGK